MRQSLCVHTKSFSEKNFASHMPGRCFGGSAYNKRPWWKIEVWESGSAQERETHGFQKGSAVVKKKKKKSQVNLMDWWKQEQRTWHVLEALGFENEGGMSNALSGRLTAGALRYILARVLKWAWGGQAWTVSLKQMVYIPVTPRRVFSKRTSHPKDKRGTMLLNWREIPPADQSCPASHCLFLLLKFLSSLCILLHPYGSYQFLYTNVFLKSCWF